MGIFYLSKKHVIARGVSPVAIPSIFRMPLVPRDCHAAFAARNDVITGRAILESPLRLHLFDQQFHILRDGLHLLPVGFDDHSIVGDEAVGFVLHVADLGEDGAAEAPGDLG